MIFCWNNNNQQILRDQNYSYIYILICKDSFGHTHLPKKATPLILFLYIYECIPIDIVMHSPHN